MKNKKNKGFSVIEIVLVLGVIGILSSFIAPKVRDYMAMAKNSKAINILQNLRMANESYFLENGNYIELQAGEGTGEIIAKLKKYLGGNISVTSGDSLLVDIGGSKSASNSTENIYGGKLKIILDNNEFKFKLMEDSSPKFNMRGEEWTKL